MDKKELDIHSEITRYIIKNYINKRSFLSKMTSDTVTIYKSELYKIFSTYSKKQVDQGIDSIDDIYNIGPKLTKRPPNGFNVHGVKKVIIKD